MTTKKVFHAKILNSAGSKVLKIDFEKEDLPELLELMKKAGIKTNIAGYGC